jgi:hypothetical protein
MQEQRGGGREREERPEREVSAAVKKDKSKDRV